MRAVDLPAGTRPWEVARSLREERGEFDLSVGGVPLARRRLEPCLWRGVWTEADTYFTYVLDREAVGLPWRS